MLADIKRKSQNCKYDI